MRDQGGGKAAVRDQGLGMRPSVRAAGCEVWEVWVRAVGGILSTLKLYRCHLW